MNDSLILTHRQFLQNTGRVASTFVPAVLEAKCPKEIFGVGCLGLGTRVGDLINTATPLPGVKVIAVCDDYHPHRRKGIDCSKTPE